MGRVTRGDREVTEQEALNALHLATRRGRTRHRRIVLVILGLLFLGQLVWILATGFTVGKLLSALAWVLFFGIFHIWWWATPAEHTYDPEHLKRTLRGAELIPGKVVKAGTDQRLTVQTDGHQATPAVLVWTTTKHVAGLHEGDPLVLWPLSAAWSTGPWD